jgi:uncharacterized protein YukE
MPIVGADLRELSLLVTRLADRDRGELAAALDKMNASVQDSAAWWTGEHADRFRGDFAVFVTTTNRSLDTVLSQAAQVTRQNLRAISGATGAGAGPAVLVADRLAADPPSSPGPDPFADAAPVAYAGYFTSLQAWFRSTTALWASPEKLRDHAWGGPTRPSGPPHAPDFGANSEQDYAKQAYRFFQDAEPRGYQVKIAGHTIRVYDPATNSFGSYADDGTVKTFFKPVSPGYWTTQPGSPAAGTQLDTAVGTAGQRLDDASSWFSRVGRVMDTPAGRLGGRALTVLGAAGDVLTIADPSPHALGGPTTERIAAAANLGAMAVTAGPVAGLLAANAAVDWVPVAGEVVLAGTALYFAGDLIYQNRQAIGHALSWTGQEAVHVASDAVHGLASDASHAWHSLFG